ncbi:MAG: sugar transferase [Streptosporangiaceae bacterium]
MTVVRDAGVVDVPRRPVIRANNWTKKYILGALTLDFLVALGAGLAAFLIRFGSDIGPYSDVYALSTVGLPFVWLVCLALARAYEPRFLGVGSDEFRRVVNSGFVLIALVAIVAYAAKIDVARGYVVAALPLTTIATVVGRYALRKRLHLLRRRGRCMGRVVVAGHAPAVVDLVAQLRRERYHGLEIVGACLSEPGGEEAVAGVPLYGDFSDVALAVDATRANTVAVLACPEMHGSRLRRLAWQLEKTGTELVVAPGLMDVAGPRTTIRPIAGLPLLHVEHPELAGSRRLLKGAFDRACGGFALLLLSPFLAAIAVAVRATSTGPALFRQTRIGKNGREFTLYKFRTMSADAEARRAALEALNEHDGVLFKIRRDPRVTPVGAWLRRYSLDELPQLVNVAFGNMSLVGPRPPLEREVAKYGDDVRRRLVVKPGLTGLWQISGRADLSWEESVRLDLRYVENWSLTLDLVILWKTWSAVIRGAGAY